MSEHTAPSCCFRWDLRRGIHTYATSQLVFAGLRAVAAILLAWDQGNAYLVLFVNAALFAVCGGAGLRASSDYRAVLGWDPKIREASFICLWLNGITAIADLLVFVYLISWQSVHGKPDGFVAYISVQHMLFIAVGGYMTVILYMYHSRLAKFMPVIPEQTNLPPPATMTAYPTGTFATDAPSPPPPPKQKFSSNVLRSSEKSSHRTLSKSHSTLNRDAGSGDLDQIEIVGITDVNDGKDSASIEIGVLTPESESVKEGEGKGEVEFSVVKLESGMQDSAKDRLASAVKNSEEGTQEKSEGKSEKKSEAVVEESVPEENGDMQNIDLGSASSGSFKSANGDSRESTEGKE